MRTVTKPSLEALQGGEVHVWYAHPDAFSEAQVGRCEALLSPNEQEKGRRFYFEGDRRLYRVSHAMVRCCLSAYGTGRAPQDWAFVENEHGRPDLPPDPALPPLNFNLSHTRGLAAVAVASGVTVGVDVEHADRNSAAVAIADRFFSATEVAHLHALPEAQQRSRFFDFWTLKESYIKARGKGLSIPLGKFAFTLKDGAPVSIATAAELEDDPAAWQFALWSFGPAHRAALAVRRGESPDRDVGVFPFAPDLL